MSALTSAVECLSGPNAKPACPDHQPMGEYVQYEDGVIVEITCPNCGFLGVAHPAAWEEMSR